MGAGIPDLQTLADVMAGSVTGWHELLTTLPFVDLAGPPALVPYLLGFVGAGVAGTLALRGRSAGLPLLPLFAVVVVVLLLRRPEGGPADWYPVAFAGVAVVWLVFRGLEFSADEVVPVQGREHGRLARAVTAALVVVAALAVTVPLTGGRPATAGASLRGQVDAAPELAGLDSPLRRFRTFTEQPDAGSENVHRKLLLTVTGAPAGRQGAHAHPGPVRRARVAARQQHDAWRDRRRVPADGLAGRQPHPGQATCASRWPWPGPIAAPGCRPSAR